MEYTEVWAHRDIPTMRNEGEVAVEKGQHCRVIREYWRNGEGWFRLAPLDGAPPFETFDSPDVFWVGSEAEIDPEVRREVALKKYRAAGLV